MSLDNFIKVHFQILNSQISSFLKTTSLRTLCFFFPTNTPAPFLSPVFLSTLQILEWRIAQGFKNLQSIKQLETTQTSLLEGEACKSKARSVGGSSHFIQPLTHGQTPRPYQCVGQPIYLSVGSSILELEIRNEMLGEGGIVYLYWKIKSYFFLPKVKSDLAYWFDKWRLAILIR